MPTPSLLFPSDIGLNALQHGCPTLFAVFIRPFACKAELMLEKTSIEQSKACAHVGAVVWQVHVFGGCCW